jgi:hypothetical protein
VGKLFWEVRTTTSPIYLTHSPSTSFVSHARSSPVPHSWVPLPRLANLVTMIVPAHLHVALPYQCIPPRTPPSPMMTDIIVQIMTELLTVLALATKQIQLGRFSKCASSPSPPATTPASNQTQASSALVHLVTAGSVAVGSTIGHGICGPLATPFRGQVMCNVLFFDPRVLMPFPVNQ